MQSQKRKRYHKDNAPSDDIITLISLVRQNPALYNYKLQPNQRRRADILNGWAEIAAQIGNKYSVEECRRKWKNLRDTYHQYRLRKPKYTEGGLSKWRYAKELEFLSNVYQPKLKSQRNNLQFDATVQSSLLEIKKHEDEDVMVDDDELDDEHESATNNSITHHATTQILDETETFILTAYEESVNDDVVTSMDQHHNHHHHHHSQHHQQQSQHHQHHQQQAQHHHHHHHHHHNNTHDDDPHGITSIELSHVVDDVVDDDDVCEDDVDTDDVNDIVKHEPGSSLDGDGATGAEVDYEEVCLYEEAGHTPNVDCEIGVGGDPTGSTDTSPDSKGFRYIDATDFCLSAISASSSRTQFPSGTNSVLSSGNSAGAKLKNLTLVTTNQSTSQQQQHQHHQQQQQNGHIDVKDNNATHLLGNGTLIGVAETTDNNATTAACVSTAVAIDTTASALSTTTFTTPTILQMPVLSTPNISAAQTPTHTVNGGSSNTLCALPTPTTIATATTEDAAAMVEAQSAQTERDELDLFFDFLKKKIQSFPKAEITHIQVEFLNCVLKREAQHSNT